LSVVESLGQPGNARDSFIRAKFGLTVGKTKLTNFELNIPAAGTQNRTRYKHDINDPLLQQLCKPQIAKRRKENTVQSVEGLNSDLEINAEIIENPDKLLNRNFAHAISRTDVLPTTRNVVNKLYASVSPQSKKADDK